MGYTTTVKAYDPNFWQDRNDKNNNFTLFIHEKPPLQLKGTDRYSISDLDNSPEVRDLKFSI